MACQTSNRSTTITLNLIDEFPKELIGIVVEYENTTLANYCEIRIKELSKRIKREPWLLNANQEYCVCGLPRDKRFVITLGHKYEDFIIKLGEVYAKYTAE